MSYPYMLGNVNLVFPSLKASIFICMVMKEVIRTADNLDKKLKMILYSTIQGEVTQSIKFHKMISVSVLPNIFHFNKNLYKCLTFSCIDILVNLSVKCNQ